MGNQPSHLRPERGLLQIRKHFELSVNLRPVRAFTGLLDASPLKREVAAGVDIDDRQRIDRRPLFW